MSTCTACALRARSDLCMLVLPQDSHCRRLEIVELTRAHGPDEDGDGARGEQEGRREQNEHHRHPSRRVGAKDRARNELTITVRDDKGMRIAATRGLIV